MDYDDATYGTRGPHTDSVQWQGSQTACAALDSLLSEASFKPAPDVFRASKDPTSLHSTRSDVKGASHSLRSSSFALDSAPLSSRPFGNILGSSTLPPRIVLSRPSTPKNLGATPSPLTLLSDCRSRQSRLSNAVVVDAPPVGDPDQFLNMLKGISDRIDGNIRSDASTSTDMPRRRPPSKRVLSSSNVGAKRVKHNNSLASRTSSVSEKGAAPDVGAWSRGSTDIPRALKHTHGSHKNCSSQMSTDTPSEMDVDPPRMSRETMPPPLVPPPKARSPSISDSTTRLNQLHSPALSSASPQITGEAADTVSCHLITQHSSNALTKNPLPTQTLPPTPTLTPKLHPLLDPERKQRRLRLERTISASLTSSPAELPSTSKPIRQRQCQTRAQPSPPYPSILPRSQGSVSGSLSGQASLGMRRTHTFPTINQKSRISCMELMASPSSKKRIFKSPLLSSSQPLSAISTNSFSHGGLLSDQSPSSSKTSPPTSSEMSTPKSGDESTDDLPSSSDGDISFGDAVPLDMDMDALEETMRKYD